MSAVMVGYEVVGSDDHKIGKVAAIESDLLIVEGGLLHKTKHAIPTTFAHPDDDGQVVRLTISKNLVDDSPPLKNGDIDRHAVAEHYGLAEGDVDSETEGVGELTPSRSRRKSASSSRNPVRDS